MSIVYYHMHSTLTNPTVIDSATPFEEYIKMAKDEGCTALAFSEHGNNFEWVKKKKLINEAGMKYIHGVEAYMTTENQVDIINKTATRRRETLHIGLYAKNFEGVKEINSLVFKSHNKKDGHYYYRPRIFIDELYGTSDNIIVTTACLGNLLWQYRSDEKKIHEFMTWASKNSDRVFLEVQHHLDETQKEYNKMLLNLSREYGVRIIAGTDTHSSSAERAIGRRELQHSKNMFFGLEDSFDTTWKSEADLIEIYKQQNVLNDFEILEAINNTCVMADMVEDFEFDRSFKYPDHIYDNPNQQFKSRVIKMFTDKVKDGIISKEELEAYKSRINQEVLDFEKLGMEAFMLFMSELCTWCWDNDIAIGFNRGSVGGSEVAYILDIIDLDPIIWKTVFSRFANSERVSLADVDIDLDITRRDEVFEYIISRFGDDYCSYIVTYNTIAEKGTIDEIGRATFNRILKKKEITKESAEGRKNFKVVEDWKKKVKKLIDTGEFEAYLEDEKNEYIAVRYRNMLGTIISKGKHPAGMIASPVTLSDNLGLYIDTDGHVISCNSMKYVDYLNFVKYDLLGLKNVSVIKRTYDYLGQKYKKSHEINWNDENVWRDMITHRGALFQFESEYGFSMLKQFEPHEINHMSLVNAAIRPSAQSYRDSLMAKKVKKNPSELIDNLLKDNFGYLVYQEDTIKFLQDVCGMTPSSSDSIRRFIGKKMEDKLHESLPMILDGYCEVSDKPRKVAEEEAKEFLQIIDDSSEYQFGFNHSTGYSMIGYVCAKLRYYHPLEFITAFFNFADNEDDIIMGKELAVHKQIDLKPVRYGFSKGEYYYDKSDNSVYLGIGAIKGLNTKKGDELYKFSRKHKCNTLYDVFNKLNYYTKLDKSDMESLIKLNFFERFGKNGTIFSLYQEFLKFKKGKAKVLKKTDIKEYKVPKSIIEKYSTQTDKQYKLENTPGMLNEYFKQELKKDIKMKSIRQIMVEVDLIGFPFTKIEGLTDNHYVAIKIEEGSSPLVTLYNISTGELKKVKVDRNRFNEYRIRKGNVVKSYEIQKVRKVKFIDGEYERTNDIEYLLADYEVKTNVDHL